MDKLIDKEFNLDEKYPLDNGLFLCMEESGLVLSDGQLKMRGDFTDMLGRLRQSNLEKEMLIKAVRIKGAGNAINVVDATAGMGEDSILLAAAGFNVTMYEYNPVIATLLKDTIKRAQNDEKLSEIVGRMTIINEDSIKALRKLDYTPDVVVLDPMFPERQKTALIKKKFQLLQRLESPCGNEEELLEAAKAANPKKIVIKRPLKGAYLAGIKPTHSYTGKAIRYDCIICQ